MSGTDDQNSATTRHVRAALGGDPESLAWLFRHFSPLLRAQAVYRLGEDVGRVDPSDVVSEAWLVCASSLERACATRAREGADACGRVRYCERTVSCA